jgi:cysteine desulfurase
LAHGSIRFSFGKFNTLKEIDQTIEYLKEDVAFLRNLSPLYKED